MALNQLTVFVQNQKGVLVDITNALSDANIDIRALSIADTKDFGILRLIVDGNEKALATLKGKGYLVNITPVVGVKIGDAPGKLARALEVVDKAGINVEYLYAFLTRTEKHAYVVIRVADNNKAEQVLEEAGFHLITDADVHKLL